MSDYVTQNSVELNAFKFEDLKVYQKSIEFVDKVFKITNTYPKDEMYGLTSQFRRASQSIALNMAEGAGQTTPQFVRYLNISKGSINECVVCITISSNQKYITKEEQNDLRKDLIELSKMITGLIKSIKIRSN